MVKLKRIINFTKEPRIKLKIKKWGPTWKT
jgi:hypothetical protein